MSKLLLTGATGHLGAATARAALAAGHEVVALARPKSDRRGLKGLAVTIVEGDLCDPASLAVAVAGCELVLHAGAVYRSWAADEADILRPAIEGTENVVRAARTAGARRVVVTSSNAAIGYGADPSRPLDETSWNEAPRAAYIRAKTLSERRGFEVGREVGMEVVSICPSGIIGPWDWRNTPTTRSVIAMVGGGPAVLDVALTDVRDVASGLLLAAEKGRAGERYLIAGDNCTKERIAQIVGGITGRKVKAMLPPRAVMWLLAAAGELRASLGGPDPDLTRAALADVYGRHLLYDHGKAVRELGWTFRPAEEAIRDAIRWVLFTGALTGRIAADLRTKLPPDPSWA